MRKDFVLLLCFGLILTLSSLITIETTVATSIPKPSVPEFTVNLIDSSYDTQSTTTIDPYTGQTVTHPSQHIEARTIQIGIKYVDFTPFEIKNETNTYTVGLQYNIRWKGHFETEWHEIYFPYKGYAVGEKVGDRYVVSYQGNYYPSEGLVMNIGFSATFPPGAQVDFQVQALIGYTHHVVVAGPFSGEVFEGETSGWSGTQTLTIGEPTQTAVPSASQSSTSPSANPTVSQVFGLDLVGVTVLVIIFVIAILLVFVVFYLRKRR